MSMDIQLNLFSVIMFIPENQFVGEGLATPLYHVGEGAVVRLIVPFKRMGNTFQSQYFPVYFKKVRYTFEK